METSSDFDSTKLDAMADACDEDSFEMLSRDVGFSRDREPDAE